MHFWYYLVVLQAGFEPAILGFIPNVPVMPITMSSSFEHFEIKAEFRQFNILEKKKQKNWTKMNLGWYRDIGFLCCYPTDSNRECDTTDTIWSVRLIE